MRSTLATAALITGILFNGLTCAVGAQEQTSGSHPGPAELARRTLQRRAVEAVIWGMPAVNYDLMLQEMLGKTTGKVGQVIYWGRPLDSKNQTLTPNPDGLYFMTFFNTKDGPIVLDLPPLRRSTYLRLRRMGEQDRPDDDAPHSATSRLPGGSVPPHTRLPVASPSMSQGKRPAASVVARRA